jgi:hypothetical protein
MPYLYRVQMKVTLRYGQDFSLRVQEFLNFSGGAKSLPSAVSYAARAS